MIEQLSSLVQAIHDSPLRAVIVTSGAGAGALAELLAVGGASRTLIEGLIPYSPAAFDDFLGRKPAHYVTAATARLLAGRAYTRGHWLESEASPLVGIACTAAIASDRPKRGDHRAHIATWQPERLVSYHLQLAKGARDRRGEELAVSVAILNALAAACGLAERVELVLGAGEQLESVETDFAGLATQLDQGERAWFGLNAAGSILEPGETPAALVAGSFNPLHEGHLGLARVAADLLGRPVAFELAAVNVDKPPLPPATVLERIAQFAGAYTVLVSNAPTYVQKARLFPGATFVVGYDTAVRIVEPRYYDNSRARMMAALDEIRQRGSRFLVAGRTDSEGYFHGPAEIEMPAGYRDLFRAIPPELFRSDISSTRLRATGARGSR